MNAVGTPLRLGILGAAGIARLFTRGVAGSAPIGEGSDPTFEAIAAGGCFVEAHPPRRRERAKMAEVVRMIESPMGTTV